MFAPVSAQAHEIDYVQYSIGALIVLQTILIVALLIQNRQRRLQAKLDAQKHYIEITHAARLALAGEITASVAHDLTQPMTAILSNVETAQFLLHRTAPDLAAIDEILADVRQDDLRAHAIVQRLRTMLRKRELQIEHVDINALASGVLTLIVPDAMRRHVAIRTALEPGLPKAPADPVHLQQVLLNLLLNAMDAMQDTPIANRWIEVRTRRQNDAFVQVAIVDNGHGVAAGAERVFDSFFTTRTEGMGLGLSIARSIVQMHGGAIWAENRAGGGAAFKFTVPVKPS